MVAIPLNSSDPHLVFLPPVLSRMRKTLMPASFSEQLLSECYVYNKSLQSLGTLGGLLSVGAFFCTKTFYLIWSSTVSAWVLQYPREMRFALVASLSYTLLLVISALGRAVLERTGGKNTKWGSELLRGIATILLLPFELSVYGVKSILVITYSFRSDFRELFRVGTDSQSTALYYVVMVLIYSDFLISVGICYMKCSILRPLIPNGGFFSKIDGNFEYFFILLIPLKHLCFYLTNSNDTVSAEGVIKAKSVVPLFYFFEIFLMIMISSIYLKELPYYNAMSERILAHFLLTTSAIFILLGAFNNSLASALKVYLFMIPVQAVSFEYFLRFSYRLDFKATIQAQQYLSLKKILVDKKEDSDHSLEDVSNQRRFDEIFEQGVYTDYVKQKKSLTIQEFNLWRDIQKFRRLGSDDSDQDLDEGDVEKIKKSETGRSKTHAANQTKLQGSFSIHPSSKVSKSATSKKLKPDATKTELAGDDNPEDNQRMVDEEAVRSINQSSQGRSSRLTDSKANKKGAQKDKASIRSVNHRIEAMVVNCYVENNNKSPYAHLIRIYWMLTSKVVVFGLYRDLKDLLELSTNFRSQSIYYYALKEVEDYMKTWYDNPAAVDIEGAENAEQIQNSDHSETRFRPESNQKSSSLDLAYALYHAHTLKYLKGLIGGFSTLNSKFIELVKSKSSFKYTHGKLGELMQKDKEINTLFRGYHRDSKPTEKDHVLPYVLHLSINTNLVRTGKLFLTEYIKRNLIFKKVQEERNPGLTSDTILIDSLVFLFESDQSSLGTILEVFGDAERLLGVEEKSLIGKTPNYLLPESVARCHPELMKNYMEQPLRYFFGDSRESIVKIPNSNLVVGCQIAVKIVPTVESAFRIIVGLKPNLKKYNHKLVLNRRMQIECYSENFLTTVKQDYLQPKLPLEKMSSTLHEYVLSEFEHAQQFRGEVRRILKQRKVANRFKKIIRGGLLGIHQSKELDMVTMDSKRFNDSITKTEGSRTLGDSNLSGDGIDRSDREVFKVSFPSSKHKNKVFKTFEVAVEVREFPQINQRVVYLDMILLDENDYKLIMMKNKNLEKTGTLGQEKFYNPAMKGSGSSMVSKSDMSKQQVQFAANQGPQSERYEANPSGGKHIGSMTNMADHLKDEDLSRAMTNPIHPKSLIAKEDKIKLMAVPMNTDLQKMMLMPPNSDMLSSNQPSNKDSLESDPEEVYDYEDEEFDEFFIPRSEDGLNFNDVPALNKLPRRDSLQAPNQQAAMMRNAVSDPENAISESDFKQNPIARQKYTAPEVEKGQTKLLKDLNSNGGPTETRYKFFGIKGVRPIAIDVDSVKGVSLFLIAEL